MKPASPLRLALGLGLPAPLFSSPTIGYTRYTDPALITVPCTPKPFLENLSFFSSELYVRYTSHQVCSTHTPQAW